MDTSLNIKLHIARINLNQDLISKLLGITRKSFRNKVEGTSEFKLSEIKTLLTLFDTTFEELFN